MNGMNGSELFINATNHSLHRNVSTLSVTYPFLLKVVVITISSLLMLVSLTGNVLVVAVFYRNQSLRTTVNYFIVNMAISDLLIPVFYLPYKISQFYLDGIWLVDGILGSFLCKITKNTWYISILVSMFSMLAIAMDRFHAVVFPMKLPLFSRKKCQIIIALTWIASIAFFGHILYAIKIISSDNALRCVLNWDYTKEVFKYTWICFFCFSLFSSVVLTVLYSTILLSLFRQKKNLRLASEVVRKRAARDRKISLILVFVVIAFYAVWIPFNTTYLIIHFNLIINMPYHILIPIVDSLPCLNSVISPIVYFTFNERYRQGLMELFCCSGSSRPVSPQGEDNVQNAGQINNAIELHEQ